VKAKKPVTWTASAVQYAIAVQLDFYKYCIVPNIHLGGNDEMDMGILSPSRLLWEVEIKISRDDWHRDIQKKKWVFLASDTIYAWTPSRFYYAVPRRLVYKDDVSQAQVPDWVPDKAGIIAVYNHRSTKTWPDGSQSVIDKPTASIVRTAKPLHRNKLEDKYVDEMYRKLSIRYWRATYKKEPGNTIILPEE